MASITPKLVSFDLDGTLFPGRTTCLELGRLLGHLDLISDLESRYSRFEISTTEVAEKIASAYQGRDILDIEQAVLQIPLIGGFQDTIRSLKEHGVHILIVTVTWCFAARALVHAHGLHGCSGARMGEDGTRFTGEVERHFEEYHKPQYVREYAEGFGFDLSHCVAVGDGRSDISLFKEVGLAIALNATKEARAAAHVSLDTNDLTDILPHVLAN